MASGICSACFLRKRRRCGGYPFRRYAPAPPRGSLSWRRQTFRHCQKPSPWGRWLRPAGADGRGTSRAIRLALEPKTFPPCQGLPPRGSWQNRQVLTEGVPLKCSKAVRHSPDGLAALIGKDRSGDGNGYFARPSFFSRFKARMTCTLVTRLPGVKTPSPMSGSSPVSTAQRAALAVSGSVTSL